MTTVPSNLVPTKITDLPVAPSPTSSATMVCVIGGVTYQVAFIDLQSTVSVPASRAIYTGGGLQGGGDFSEDRTHSIADGGVTNDKLADNGVAAGTYGSGTTIPVITVDAKGLVTSVTEDALVISGYVPDTRQIVAGTGLIGGGNLQANRTLAADFSIATPAALGSASPGVSDQLSRGDHIHPALDLASPTELTGVLLITNGGTGTSITNLTAGAVWYSDGSNAFLASVQGVAGQVLVSNGNSAPTWGSALVISDQPANYVYAGPTSGVDAPTAFRLLVNEDIPSTLTGKTLDGSLNTFTDIGNSSLTNSSITINGTTIDLGGSGTITSTGVTSVGGTGTVNGITLTGTVTSTGNLTLGGALTGVNLTTQVTGTLPVANGGTGATTLTGYVKGTGTSALTASASIPNTDITGLGTMSTQAAGAVAITGGSINNTVIGAATPAAATFTSAAMTTGTVSTQPSVGIDLANKTYVDTVAAQSLTYHSPVYVESPSTAGNLNALYNQPGGAGVGVGATLTNNGTKAALVIDGVLMTTTKRVLIYNQTNAFENGVYTVTTVGTPDPGGTNWVLTRATDADTYAPANPNALGQGDAFFVTAGDTGAGELYAMNTVGAIVFGSTAITFVQISASTPYLAGTGLNLNPATTFNISNVGTAGTYGSASSVPVLTTNAQGQVTGVTDTSIAIANTAVSGLGTMSTQAASSVAITGGAIDGTTIGATTATTGNFTTVTATTGVFGGTF